MTQVADGVRRWPKTEKNGLNSPILRRRLEWKQDMTNSEVSDTQKWQKEIEWRERDLRLKADDLALRRSFKVWGFPLLGTVSALLSTAAVVIISINNSNATEKLEYEKRKYEIRAEQFKSIKVSVKNYIDSFSSAVNRIQSVAVEQSSGEKLTAFIYRELDKQQRKDIQAMNLAGAAMFLEDQEVAFGFAQINAAFAKLDDEVFLRLRNSISENPTPTSRERWIELNNEIGQLNIQQTLSQLKSALTPPELR